MLTVEDVRNGKISCRRGKKSEHTVEELREHSNPLLNEKAVLAAWLRQRGDADGSIILFTSRLGSGKPANKSTIYSRMPRFVLASSVVAAIRTS
jgi:hypothetical protein